MRPASPSHCHMLAPEAAVVVALEQHAARGAVATDAAAHEPPIAVAPPIGAQGRAADEAAILPALRRLGFGLPAQVAGEAMTRAQGGRLGPLLRSNLHVAGSITA